jgi:DNA invertase Pin-like site-specific DNA recombinase
MKLGYVGKKEILPIELQVKALEDAGCWEIYNQSDSDNDGQLLKEIISFAKEGDIIVIYKLSCLGLSNKKLVDFVNELSKRRLDFISIHDGIDTSKKEGKVVFKVFGALKTMEMDLLELKTQKGLNSAKARGLKGGRPKKDSELVQKAIEMYKKQEYSIREIVESTGVSKSTLYREIKKSKSNFNNR